MHAIRMVCELQIVFVQRGLPPAWKWLQGLKRPV